MAFMDPNFKVPVEVDPTEDTQWNDILREKGVIPERPPSPTAELEAALEEAVKKQHDNRLEGKELDELDELEDEEDEDFLNSYKQKRFSEIKKLSERQKFGLIYPITKPEYKEEVTDASQDSHIFLHLTLSSSIQSRLLSSIMQRLAPKFPEVKFCEIPGNRCVENYPDSNCPTIIIYHKKDVVKQYITLMELGGNDCKDKDIEKILVASGAVPEKDGRLIINQDDEDEGDEDGRRLKFVQKSLRGRSSGDSEDDDDDFYD